MLAKRIIPCLDVKDGRVVKGIKFLSLRDAGDPASIAKFYDAEGADEIVFLDITASVDARATMLDVVRKTSCNIYMPLTVGGGVGSISDIRNLLNSGADKVSINTAAVKNPNLIREAADRFGSQCVVLAIDAKREQKSQIPAGNSGKAEQKWRVFINGGKTPTKLDALKWAIEAERLGAGEILLTSMDRDGTKLGYDLDLTRTISKIVKIPVIASGGAGRLEDFLDVFNKGSADAALAASIFHYRQYSIKEVKRYLKTHNVRIRI